MESKISVFIFLFFMVFMGYSQTSANTNEYPFKIKLQKGANASFTHNALSINPINLFIQDKPWNDRSAHIQLELDIKEQKNAIHTFLWYFEKGRNPLTNYPLVYGKYLYSLEIDAANNVSLVIDTLSFEKPFYIEISKEAHIGNLKIRFKESMDVMGARTAGDGSPQNESYAEYELVVGNNKEEKTFSFTSLNENDKTTPVLKWKNYEIKILYTDLRLLKLAVYPKVE